MARLVGRLFDDLSLRRGIPLRVMGAVFGTAFVVTAALGAREYEDTQRALEAHPQSLARVLANTLITPVLHDDIWRAYEILRSARHPNVLGPDHQAEPFIVTDAEAKVFVANRPEDFPVGSELATSRLASPALDHVLRSDSLGQQMVTSEGQPSRIVLAPLVSDGVILGHVLFGYSKSFYLTRLTELIRRAHPRGGGMLTAIRTHRRHEGDPQLSEQTLSLLERGLTQIRNTVAALLVETKTEDRPLEPADIDDLIILAEAEAHAKGVRLQRQGGSDGPLPLMASLVRQIVLNLLLNAIQAAGSGGTATLSVRQEMDKLLLEIENDGEHIPLEQLGYPFEPFVSGRAHGHGLGLWVVYQIVHQRGGGLSVQSEPGKTHLTVVLPYAMSA